MSPNLAVQTADHMFGWEAMDSQIMCELSRRSESAWVVFEPEAVACAESAYWLPSSWNVMPFCPEYDQAGYEEAPGAFIGILHFTCTIKQHMYVNLLGFGRWAWLVQVARSAQPTKSCHPCAE